MSRGSQVYLKWSYHENVLHASYYLCWNFSLSHRYHMRSIKAQSRWDLKYLSTVCAELCPRVYYSTRGHHFDFQITPWSIYCNSFSKRQHMIFGRDVSNFPWWPCSELPSTRAIKCHKQIYRWRMSKFVSQGSQRYQALPVREGAF